MKLDKETKKYLDYCDSHESGIITQMRSDLDSFAKALPQLRQRRREKFEAGVKEHGLGFLDIDPHKIRGMALEELIDWFHYTAQPRFKAYRPNVNPFKS